MTSSIGSSIISTLGAGSGIDTNSLVSSLVSEVKSTKQSAITTQQSLNNSRISAMGSAISSLDTFSTELTNMLKDTAYAGQPASTHTAIASVSLLKGGTPTGLPAQLEVKQLAQAQVVTSATMASGSAIGTGTLTLTTASGAHAITIDSGNSSLAGIASAINGANAGVTATVMTDAAGSRLVLKGVNGQENGFTLTMEPTDTADADLQKFIVGSTATSLTPTSTSGMTQTQAATNARIVLDGVEMEYTDNVVKDAIPYLRIDLNSAAPGTKVTLATDEPTSTMADMLKDFVSAYNSLRGALNTVSSGGSGTSGVLSGESSIREMKRQLSSLTMTQLSSDGPYKSLSEIGITTNRDGTLSLDTTRLAKVMDENPAAVTQLINPTVSTSGNPGLAKAVSTISEALKGKDGPLTKAQEVYQKLAKNYTEQLSKLDNSMVDYEARLTSVYSKMETRLASLRATQTYLSNQIAAWNASKD